VFLVLTARWVLMHLLRQPLIWLWLVVLATVWPALVRFSELGVTTTAATVPSATREVAFVSTLVGVSLGLGVLSRARWFLAPVPPTRRLPTELAGLAGGAALFLAAGLLPPLIVALASTGVPGRLPLEALLTFLHLAALGLVLLRLELPGWAVQLGLPLFAWGLPGLLGRDGSFATVVQHTLAAGRHLDPEPVLPFEAQCMSACLPIIGLLGVSWLLSSPPSPCDEIRHPR
jgi:hypothetical protein